MGRNGADSTDTGAEEAMEAAEAFKTAAKQAETETGEPGADAPELV